MSKCYLSKINKLRHQLNGGDLRNAMLHLTYPCFPALPKAIIPFYKCLVLFPQLYCTFIAWTTLVFASEIAFEINNSSVNCCSRLILAHHSRHRAYYLPILFQKAERMYGQIVKWLHNISVWYTNFWKLASWNVVFWHHFARNRQKIGPG